MASTVQLKQKVGKGARGNQDRIQAAYYSLHMLKVDIATVEGLLRRNETRLEKAPRIIATPAINVPRNSAVAAL